MNSETCQSGSCSLDDTTVTTEYLLERLWLFRYGNYIQINELRALFPNRGDGSRFLSDLCTIADKKGWTLTLTPDLGLGATSIGRLNRFYKRFGFVENKGRNIDFTTQDSMLRKPHSK